MGSATFPSTITYFSLSLLHFILTKHLTVFTAPDDPSVLKQRPPKFDAELIAELVIRIITTSNSKNGVYSGSDGSSKAGSGVSGYGDTVGGGDVGIVAADGSGGSIVGSVGGASGVVKRGSRLSGIKQAAANFRNVSTTTPAATPITTTTTPSATTDTPTTTTTPTPTTPTTDGTGDAILVFLSGIQSIEKVNKALRQRGVLQGLKAQVCDTTC